MVTRRYVKQTAIILGLIATVSLLSSCGKNVEKKQSSEPVKPKTEVSQSANSSSPSSQKTSDAGTPCDKTIVDALSFAQTGGEGTEFERKRLAVQTCFGEEMLKEMGKKEADNPKPSNKEGLFNAVVEAKKVINNTSGSEEEQKKNIGLAEKVLNEEFDKIEAWNREDRHSKGADHPESKTAENVA